MSSNFYWYRIERLDSFRYQLSGVFIVIFVFHSSGHECVVHKYLNNTTSFSLKSVNKWMFVAKMWYMCWKWDSVWDIFSIWFIECICIYYRGWLILCPFFTMWVHFFMFYCSRLISGEKWLLHLLLILCALLPKAYWRRDVMLLNLIKII